jgi:uroporphyrinogen-III decarboxylase
MNSRERVLASLSRREPDRVPYCELGIDPVVFSQVLGWRPVERPSLAFDSGPYTAEEHKAIAQALNLDNICYDLRPPIYVHKRPGKDGRLYYGDGMIRSRADIAMVQLPDPYDDALYAEAAEFVRQKGDYAACFVTRIGIFNVMLSMGLEAFCLALYDNSRLVETLLDMYTWWTGAVAGRVCQLGFDVFVSTDDLAFNVAPYFSPAVFHDLVMPYHRRVAEKITLPWIMHSDGNVLPLIEDILSLGIAGLHPIEKGAMDIGAFKRTYGHRVCVLGNVDLNILGMGSAEDVQHEVRELIRVVAPGGGYIVTSGNSLASYVRAENAIALGNAVRRYGHYPITL